MKKEDISLLALNHTKQMEKEYLAEIAYSINESEIFRDNSKFRERIPKIENTNFSIPVSKLINIDSVNIIFLPEIQQALAEGKRVAVLNFASFKNPGGKFIDGSTAQEECLCHNSYLYNVLESFYNSYYVPNQRNTYNCLYNNSAIYCAGIRFWNKFLHEKVTEKTPSSIVDVITCAAPNRSAALKYHMLTSMQVNQALESRINFIKAICQIKKVDILIAGAWGCGVFGNDAYLVANRFKKIFDNKMQYPSLIIHPVPEELSKNNFLNFRKCFSKLVEKDDIKEWY